MTLPIWHALVVQFSSVQSLSRVQLFVLVQGGLRIPVNKSNKEQQQ